MSNIEDKRELEEEFQGWHDTLLFIFLGLLFGQVLKHITNKTKIPYTPVITLAGIGIGLLADYTGGWGGGAEHISDIDPHSFLVIFLPPLIFESAFSIDWHIIKTEIIQILILAGPVLVC
jgi:NhaP-type Na+/H+ or K+/H+ antiporter